MLFEVHFKPTHYGNRIIFVGILIIKWNTLVNLTHMYELMMRKKWWVAMLESLQKLRQNIVATSIAFYIDTNYPRENVSELMTVLNDAIKIINYVTPRPLKIKLIKLICDVIGSQNMFLPLHAEVRWLCGRSAFTSLIKLRAKVINITWSLTLNWQKC